MDAPKLAQGGTAGACFDPFGAVGIYWMALTAAQLSMRLKG